MRKALFIGSACIDAGDTHAGVLMGALLEGASLKQ